LPAALLVEGRRRSPIRSIWSLQAFASSSLLELAIALPFLLITAAKQRA
jgi:hypothetical protein